MREWAVATGTGDATCVVMLVPIGKRQAPSTDELLDALAACHHRIRLHVNLARQLAAAADATPKERHGAARTVRRYFTLGLPLHVADEDELLTPMLAGKDPYVDEALRMMSAEHESHDPEVRRLILLCHVLEHDPLHPRARAELAALADKLDVAFERHLALEESIIFPALRRCTPAERAAVHAAMRLRRQPARSGLGQTS